jgi:putative sigma-54 modulation protein
LEKDAENINFIVLNFSRNFDSSLICFLFKKEIVMKINIHTVRFSPDLKLTSHVTKKLNKLSAFHNKIIATDVFLKLDNVVHAIKDKVVEIRVWIPRRQFFVKHCCKSFEESFDCAFDSLVTQMKKRKVNKLHNPRISKGLLK